MVTVSNGTCLAGKVIIGLPRALAVGISWRFLAGGNTKCHLPRGMENTWVKMGILGGGGEEVNGWGHEIHHNY